LQNHRRDKISIFSGWVLSLTVHVCHRCRTTGTAALTWSSSPASPPPRLCLPSPPPLLPRHPDELVYLSPACAAHLRAVAGGKTSRHVSPARDVMDMVAWVFGGTTARTSSPSGWAGLDGGCSCAGNGAEEIL
jgi:hypothetical protein